MTIAVYARNTSDNNTEYLEQLIVLSSKENFKVTVFRAYLDFLNSSFK